MLFSNEEIPLSNHHRPKLRRLSCSLSSSRAVPQQFDIVVPYKPISVLPCLDLEKQNVWKLCDLELLQCQRSTLQPHPIWNSRPYGSIPMAGCGGPTHHACSAKPSDSGGWSCHLRRHSALDPSSIQDPSSKNN
jgi:hypothetical protein